jgi:hypothetical protein
MQVELFAPSNQPDKLMPLAHGDNKHVPLLLLLQQEQEWVAEDTVGMLCQEQEQEDDVLAKAWNAVVDCPSFENLQALKWYFGEWAYDKNNSYGAGAQLSIDYGKNQTTVVMEIGGVVMQTTFEKYFPPSAYKRGGEMQSPGVCIVEPCGWMEGWPEAAGKSHSEYHGWDKKK